MARRWERRKNKKNVLVCYLGNFEVSEIFYTFAIRKKINIMAMFLGSLVVIGVFVVIEIIGNAIKNTEDSENEKGN